MNTLPHTHFLSIPLNYPSVVENATHFNQDLVKEMQKKAVRVCRALIDSERVRDSIHLSSPHQSISI